MHDAKMLRSGDGYDHVCIYIYIEREREKEKERERETYIYIERERRVAHTCGDVICVCIYSILRIHTSNSVC